MRIYGVEAVYASPGQLEGNKVPQLSHKHGKETHEAVFMSYMAVSLYHPQSPGVSGGSPQATDFHTACASALSGEDLCNCVFTLGYGVGASGEMKQNLTEQREVGPNRNLCMVSVETGICTWGVAFVAYFRTRPMLLCFRLKWRE